jgi:hypothetical protein
VPEVVPAQSAENEGTDSAILNNANADAPATEELHENAKAALLAEYTALKNEQTQRIVVRDTVLYVSMTANTAIAAIYQQQQHHDPRILLAIPFVSTLLFWIYATNDSMITQIRRYIVVNIIPKWSADGKNSGSGLFGWEYMRRRRTLSRFLSKLIRLLAVWSTFSGASIVALIATAPNSQNLPHDVTWLFAAAFTLTVS